jgi:thioredoxin 1
MAVKLTAETFNDEIAKHGVALVDFWADWCGPCKMVGPIIEEIAEEFDGKALVGKVNVDEEEDFSREMGIMSIPTMVFFKDGKEVGRVVGTRPKEDLVRFLSELQ